ncbi:LamG domain-containing protein [Allorhodopirellula solitaria]|uniref:LamG-like jellyroll fold domain-containing protein n=1 Tax=Allorhodopirellula solitaria TaxID=2527987 RepID=A0A5C5WNS0_9BACT|nr:LamG domain-containing protein [Allorhodopirellula solitaria]TWT51663.1 hypothetical protein CA85_52230 [Allorhodopirellula solitaria]
MQDSSSAPSGSHPVHDFIISPGHTSVIPSLNVYHQDLEWSRVKPNQFLTMTADTTKKVPELTVKFRDKTGQENLVKTITYDELTPTAASGLEVDRRAHWSFDGHTTNHSVLGDRIDAKLENGATVSRENGIRGGALQLDRSRNQYASVPRSMLDDNANAYTVAGWIKPNLLPAHGSKDRHFILETKVNNHCDLLKALGTGFAISIGMRACDDATKINLQLYTETLDPKPVGSQQSPGVKSQGGFDCLIDRVLFSDWVHFAATFDSKSLHLYIDGKLVKSHVLSPAAPIAEVGGLVIGGHRAGEGRNFDGKIDEISIWNRVLTSQEIETIHRNVASSEATHD